MLLDGIGALIPFKVGLLRLYTLTHRFFHYQTLLENFLNDSQLHWRVLHYLFSTLKTRSFQLRLEFRNHPEVASSHVWAEEIEVRLKLHSISPKCLNHVHWIDESYENWGILRIVSLWELPSFWQNSKQYFYSTCSFTMKKIKIRLTSMTALHKFNKNNFLEILKHKKKSGLIIYIQIKCP